ncbi:Kazal domain protein [Fusarium subglutinans]|uniref:Kazal domain protein n=1 Tax=Gibberella subglutinans TaxID=42677 RepID=A0A8H5P6H5_GIBSU|nr:Kazal domain protein [Fusarium subglutinans]KAF5590305.1 Kazal domain protein [Fusarium subglutinans]
MLFQNILIAASIGLAAASQSSGRECGRKIAPCPEDTTCKPILANCKDINKCSGMCYFKNEYQTCGGFRATPPPPCKKGTHCVDDPRTPGDCGMACDKPGICAPNKPHTCGGIIGEKCPKGLYCYDNPSDDCDAKKGGNDCSGICL